MTGGGIRAARNLCAAAVAMIAAWSSYYHILHVALIRSLLAAVPVDLGIYVVDMSITGRS